jgi:hypothetical protein
MTKRYEPAQLVDLGPIHELTQAGIEGGQLDGVTYVTPVPIPGGVIPGVQIPATSGSPVPLPTVPPQP